MILGFGIETQDRFSCLTLITKQQLHQVRLTLTAVAKDENIAVCFVLSAPVKVHKNVAAVLVTTEIKAVFIGLSAVV